MKTRQRFLSRSVHLLTTVFLLVGAVAPLLTSNQVNAAQITDRSLILETGSTGDGGSQVSGLVNHHFTFTVPGGANVGAVVLRYCTLAGAINDPCTTPTGLSTTSATSGTQVGITGLTLDNSVNGQPTFTRTAAPVGADTEVELTLNDVTNPSTDPISGQPTFFVRMATYTQQSPNITTDTPVDAGTVAASTTTQIDLNGTMPESLVFCAGATVGKTGGVPDCSTVTTGLVNFNQLFSPTDTATASSQMAASTNAGSGYSITVNGSTLTSGSNTISPITTAGPGVHGVSQFGLNLALNTTSTSNPVVGADIDATSNGTNLRAQATADYATPDNFKFVSGESVANSAFGGAGGTDAQIFTVSYIVNVPGSQPAGTYTTTLTYVCTPTF